MVNPCKPLGKLPWKTFGQLWSGHQYTLARCSQYQSETITSVTFQLELPSKCWVCKILFIQLCHIDYSRGITNSAFLYIIMDDGDWYSHVCEWAMGFIHGRGLFELNEWFTANSARIHGSWWQMWASCSTTTFSDIQLEYLNGILEESFLCSE